MKKPGYTHHHTSQLLVGAIYTKMLALAMQQTKEVLAANILNDVFAKPHFSEEFLAAYRNNLKAARRRRYLKKVGMK